VTLLAVVAKPRWGALLAALFLMSFAANAAFVATDIGRQALVDQWERTAVAFGQPMDEGRYAQFQKLSRQAIPYVAMTQLLRGPVALAFLALVLFAWLRTATGHDVRLDQVVAVVVWSSVILAIREVIAVPVNVAREAIGSPTTLAQIFPASNAASPLARFFGVIDVFVLWWLTVLAIGLSLLSGRRTWRVAVALYGVYVAVAVALALTMAVMGGTL
jgi:hypothetical protein